MKPGVTHTNLLSSNVLARDIVEINVEKVVWPSNESESPDRNDPTNWASQDSVNWDGLVLAPAWYIEKSLGEIINGSIGYAPDEEISRLMTGVPYGAPDYVSMKDYQDAAGSPNEYYQTLQNNANRFTGGGTLTITFKPNSSGGYEVKTYVGTETTDVLVYSNSNVTNGTGTEAAAVLSSIAPGSRMIRVQSHWDSGVKYTELKIGPPPE